MTASRQCNLECVKDQGEGEVIEFIGPVKIVLVDQPSNVYRRRVWGASFIVLAQMMVAATTMTLLFYALSYKSDFLIALHVFACTVGYQLFVPIGILSLNKQNGAAAPMRIPDRKFEHLLLQFLGIGMAIGVTVLLFLSGTIFKNFTLHSFSGLVAGSFAALTVFTGLIFYGFFKTPEAIARFENISRFISVAHRTLGVITFSLSSLCFMLGICRPRFQLWVPVPQIIGFLLIFCILYTAVVLYRPIRRILEKVF